jgi:hypothetical protein
MPKYMNTRGRSKASIAICDRCQMKRAYDDISNDRNIPGLRVCSGCNDERDPWRLPARQTEKIALRFPRPDVNIAVQSENITTEESIAIATEVPIKSPANGNLDGLSQ